MLLSYPNGINIAYSFIAYVLNLNGNPYAILSVYSYKRFKLELFFIEV